jgi:multidrug efflux system membrane fusion protein
MLKFHDKIIQIFHMRALKSINANPKLKLIVAIIFITIFWMFSGLLKSSKKVEPAEISKEVHIKSMQSTGGIKTKYVVFTATAFANDSVDLITQITGRVVKKFVSDGARLKTGDKIIQIDNPALAERVDQMKDAVKSAKLRYESSIELKMKQLGSQLDVENAKTALNAAEADLAAAQIALGNSFIIAPFDGVIDSIFVQEGDMLSNMGSGQSLVGKFINIQSVVVKAYASQKEREEIQNSNEAVIINDNGQTSDAKITLISSSADQHNGTFLIKAVSDNSISLVDGESVKLKVKVGDVQAHNVPVSTLIIDKDGDLAVKAVDENKSIKEYKTNIIDEDDNGVWITGLPEKCEVILAGQSYSN